MTQKLSGIVGEHIRAVNTFDTDAIVATFAEDGQFNWVSRTKRTCCSRGASCGRSSARIVSSR
jgi:hypothetical protein